MLKNGLSQLKNLQNYLHGSNEKQVYLVQIHIVEARNLSGMDEEGTSDPFVRIKVGNLPS